MKFNEKIKEYTIEKSLLFRDAVIVVGVSGGIDSMALLYYLHSLRETMGLQLIVAHVDHMFRGEESYGDLCFVKQICSKLNVIFEGEQIDVGNYQQEHKIGVQVAARDCRYAFYEKIMKKYDASLLALAHHGDDQVETILMRLMRGSSYSGYGGMESKRPFGTGAVIRPFLCVTKAEIEMYCAEKHIPYRQDPSNAKDEYMRNRIRKYILPFMKEENPNVHERFRVFSEQLKEEDAFLQELSRVEMNKVIKKKDDNCVIISISALLSLPKTLQWRGIHLILNYLYKNNTHDLLSIHIRDILTIFKQGAASNELFLPNGLKLIRSYDEGIFTFQTEVDAPFYHSLMEDGIIYGDGWEIKVRFTNTLPIEKSPYLFVCQKEVVQLPIVVRNRQPHDRLEVKGMNGTKKVKSIFIDKKVSRNLREKWPIVTDSGGRLLWIPMLQKSIFENQDVKVDDFVVIEYIRY